MSRMSGVTFLPEKLRGPEKHSRAQLPANHISPLIEEKRQIAVALNPFRKKVANDGFRCWANDIGLFELFAARDSDDGQFWREALDVLRFLFQEALWY